MRVLIVEDEKRLSMIISELLHEQGFLTDSVYNGEDGLDSALSGIYDVIILDVMLPKMNGMDVLREIRKKGVTSSVLILTARAETDDKIQGFNSGADDYLTKPFASEELIARVRALSRRNSREYISDDLEFADIRLDRVSHELKKDGTGIRLSTKEYQLMEILMLSRKNIVERDYCINKIWGFDSDVEYNSTDVYISFLRKKLKALGSDVQIKTVRGIGYTLGDG